MKFDSDFIILVEWLFLKIYAGLQITQYLFTKFITAKI